MRIDVVTLFEELLSPLATTGMTGRAVNSGALALRFRSPRAFGHGNHRAVDDTPYGGGAGMVMRVDCLVACMEAFDEDAEPAGGKAHRVLLTPHGARFDQRVAERLAQLPQTPLPCGKRVPIAVSTTMSQSHWSVPFCSEYA